MIETLKSTEILAKEGFKVMVYCNDDPLMAQAFRKLRCRCDNASGSTYWVRSGNSK